ATWTPAVPWAGAIPEHALAVHGRFEDVAGNNLRGAFDHAIGSTVDEKEDRIVVVELDDRIPF
ncbi:MAG: hypothetical protein AAGA56_00530, partial [Myxococcota bacterium]